MRSLTRNVIFYEIRKDVYKRQGLYSGKVKNLNKQTSKPIKIRNAVYQEMRELWEKINERYILQYDSDLDDDLPKVLQAIWEKEGIFTQMAITSQREKVISQDGSMQTVSYTHLDVYKRQLANKSQAIKSH